MNARALIVIPTYNESRRIGSLLAGIRRYIDSALAAEDGLDVRFAISDDGSTVGEVADVQALLRMSGLERDVTVLHSKPNRGKGAAIMLGFETALKGEFDYVGFVDADGSVAIDDVHRALAYLHSAGRRLGLAGVIGCRVMILGYLVERPFVRRFAGRVFAKFVSLYFRRLLYDSQCGLKLFRTAVLSRYIHVPTDMRWTWDTQLLLAMLYGGEKVQEFPINWRERSGSKLSMVKDSVTMVARLVRFKRGLRGRLPCDNLHPGNSGGRAQPPDVSVR